MPKANFEELFTQAKKRAEKLPNGTIFKVRDLFKGTSWESLEKGDRVQFGGYFKRRVNGGEVNGVIYLNKASDNSALYQISKV